MQENSTLTLIIPCYQEAENIPEVFPLIIQHCIRHNYMLIAVDDGSVDGTFTELSRLMNNRMKIIRHSVNRGYGAAIKSGIRACTTEYCITIDADGQHHLSDIDLLLNAINDDNSDLVVGNRNGLGSSRFRNLGKAVIIGFTRFFFKLPVRDLNSGMKLYKTRIVQSLIHWAPSGMAFSDVITLVHLQLRYKITERDIKINPRARGESTISWRTAVQTISEIAFLVVNVFPFKFFSLLSFLFLVFALLWGIPFVLSGAGITVGSSLLILSSLVIFLQGILIELMVRIRYQNYLHINNEFSDKNSV